MIRSAIWISTKATRKLTEVGVLELQMEYKTVGLVFKTVENGRSGGHGINGLRKHIQE